jgi:hypothetical protein
MVASAIASTLQMRVRVWRGQVSCSRSPHQVWVQAHLNLNFVILTIVKTIAYNSSGSPIQLYAVGTWFVFSKRNPRRIILMISQSFLSTQHLLRILHVPGTVLGPGNEIMDKTHPMPSRTLRHRIEAQYGLELNCHRKVNYQKLQSGMCALTKEALRYQQHSMWYQLMYQVEH